MRVTLSPDAQNLTFDTDSFLFENLVLHVYDTFNIKYPGADYYRTH